MINICLADDGLLHRKPISSEGCVGYTVHPCPAERCACFASKGSREGHRTVDCPSLYSGSRQIIHVNVTRSPSDIWVAQQLREATPSGNGPKYLIRDNDRKYGSHFANVAAGIEILRTPLGAPRANAFCERFIGSLRRECLDHMLIFSEHHWRHTLSDYVQYFNEDRPHQGLDQNIPTRPDVFRAGEGEIAVSPVLGGLHHTYTRRVA